MQPVPAGYPVAELSGPYVCQIALLVYSVPNTGIQIVGCLLNWGLFGTLSVQLSFPNDSRLLKYLVYGIYVIESVQTIFVAHDTFAMFGLNYNWITVPITSAVAAGVAQVFYAYRIFVVSISRIISIFIICISMTSSVAAMIAGISAFQAGVITKFNTRKISITIGIWCGASALCDIIIAICMTHYASSFSLPDIFIDVDIIPYLTMRSTTNFRRTRILVTKIIRLTIETGSVTAVVLFIALPHQNFSYMTFGVLVPKLYANTVYMVNSRFQIIGGRDTYMSSTDMSVQTMMISDITSHSAEDKRPADGGQGRLPLVIMASEEFNDTSYEMGQMNDKPQDSCMSLPT
ncbi:hypothetical protein EDD85DRAFT_1024777 [Armillaria nabsnona]|nr:hypothetical protein EDD85DRAFT_1024777 [Armillaria nabsnona]